MSTTVEKTALGRRDLLRLGVGVVTTALSTPKAAAQGRGGQGAGAPSPGSMPDPTERRPHIGPGYKNTANRLAGNGPMDDTTRQIVRFVSEFDQSRLTAPVVRGVNRTMIDTMAAIIAGWNFHRVDRGAEAAGRYRET